MNGERSHVPARGRAYRIEIREGLLHGVGELAPLPSRQPRAWGFLQHRAASQESLEKTQNCLPALGLGDLEHALRENFSCGDATCQPFTVPKHIEDAIRWACRADEGEAS